MELWFPISLRNIKKNEYQEAVKSKPSIKRQARAFLEYGANKEGYWTSQKFMAQIKEAGTIAESKYPREKGYRLVWIFDHSSCHGAYADKLIMLSMHIK